MTPREAAELMGCTVRHIRTLISQGRLQAKVSQHVSRLGMPYFTYLLDKEHIRAYASVENRRGFPRGAKRIASRGSIGKEESNETLLP